MVRLSPVRSMLLVSFIALGAAIVACDKPPQSASSDGAPPPPAATPAPTPVAAASSAAPAPMTEGSAAPVASASAAPSASAAASAAPPADLPNVKVANIGMHIGGGPNDAVSKAPIAKSVEPHFDELRACYAKVDDQKKQGDFGLDLRIDRAGGLAKVSHPRTALKGEGFKDCMVAVFEKIDFLKPKTGTTTVSYSVRFTP